MSRIVTSRSFHSREPANMQPSVSGIIVDHSWPGMPKRGVNECCCFLIERVLFLLFHQHTEYMGNGFICRNQKKKAAGTANLAVSVSLGPSPYRQQARLKFLLTCNQQKDLKTGYDQ